MVEPNELVEFRQRWKQEITTPHLQDTDSGPITSNSQSANAASKNVGDKINSDSFSTELSPSIPKSNLSQNKPPKRSWDSVDNIREQTNVLQPFLIAENLLKGESGHASLVRASETVYRRDRLSVTVSDSKHSLSTSLPSAEGSNSTRGVTSKAVLSPDGHCSKIRKTDSSENPTFLDMFINDLVSLWAIICDMWFLLCVLHLLATLALEGCSPCFVQSLSFARSRKLVTGCRNLINNDNIE